MQDPLPDEAGPDPAPAPPVPASPPPDAKAPPERRWEWAALVVLLVTLVALRLNGRVLWCKCGWPTPWVSEVSGSHTSQHLFDPYSFTHVLHGVLYCGLLGLVFPAVGPRLRLALCVSLESSWELLENSAWIIERYRQATISLDYFGDSVLNSLSDVACCTAGYLLARRLPAWGSALFFCLVELVLLLLVRDNLTLNVVMLIHPVEGIRAWQGG